LALPHLTHSHLANPEGPRCAVPSSRQSPAHSTQTLNVFTLAHRLPHLHWARSATSAPGFGLARCHICTKTGRTPSHTCAGTAAHPCHICTGTALTPATSAPRLGSPLPHLHRDWAYPAHICTGTGLTGLTPPTPGLRSVGSAAQMDHGVMGKGLLYETGGRIAMCGGL
jgi:hypothetical protein